MLKLIFAVAALSAATPLVASERDVPKIAHIHYADLDLTSIDGNAALDRRVEKALQQVCAQDEQISLSKRLDEIRCRRAAMLQISVQRDRALAAATARASARVVARAQISAEQDRKPASSAD